MKIQCIDKEIQQLLQGGFYKIPRFQRPYSWDKDNIDEFWNDAVTDSSEDYFIGSFVVFKNGDNNYGIVDGQQRLTTITMLLCAVRNQFQIEGFEHLAIGVNNLIEKPDINNSKNYILQTESSYPYFQDHIQKFGKPEINVQFRDEERNLKESYQLLLNKVVDTIKGIKSDRTITIDVQKRRIEEKLKWIRDKVLKLKFIYVELDNEDDAYIVFETLNTRGKDLRPSDLIKNHFTKFLKAHNQSNDVAKEKWNQIKENIETTPQNISLDDFFHHEWLSKYEFTTLKELFPKFKKVVTKSKAKGALDDFIFDSQIYRYIHEPSIRDWDNQILEIRRILESLIIFKTKVQTPMILSILREFENKRLKNKNVLDILQTIENFHFIFTAITAQRTSGSIGSMYAKYSRELFKADNGQKIEVIKELKHKLSEKTPSLEEFKVNFSQLVFTNKLTKDKKLIRYILNKIHKYQSRNDGILVNYNLMTMEHIASQNSGLYKDFGDKLIGQIGNLLLIDETQNNKLDNKPYSEKKRIYLKTKIMLDDFIENNSDWTKEIIQERTDYYAELSYNEVFKIK
ncbi:MAG: DUF262 domain-containing protein [Ignavibacteriales bacterium]|nr:DUF262 domain-containing protein [Ignavibacteriales bacterium]